MFRYGTSYSSFLFDYIFLPRVSIPATLFIHHTKRSGKWVPSRKMNDFLLKLNITLYNMIGHGKKDPYDIPSTGAFKNTDCYSTLQFTITYSFKAKCRTCHNEDE